MFGLETEGIYRVPGTNSHIMSMKQMTDQIEDILVGVEVKPAVDLTVAYIKRQQKFREEGGAAAYSWWAGLSDYERVEVLAKALKENKL